MRTLHASLRRHARDAVYGNGIALVANAGVSALLGFAFWLVAARRFNADAVGIGAAVVSAATLAALLGKAGFDAAIIRYAPSADVGSLRRLVLRAAGTTVVLTLLIALGFLGVAALGLPALAPLLAPAYAGGFVVLALLTSFLWIVDAVYIAEQRAILVFWRNLAFNGVKLVVPLAVATAWAGRAVPLAWAVGLLAALVVALAMLPRVLRRHRASGAPPTATIQGYAMRNYTLNLAEFVPGLVLPILVLHALGAEANARFFLAWTVATVAFLASKAIAQSSFAALVREGEGKRALRKGALLSALVLGPATLVLVAGAAPILALFGDAYASQGATLLRILALSIPFVAVSNLYLAYLKARDASWELTLLPAATLVVLLAVMPVALAIGGIVGLGVVWLAVQVVAGIYSGARILVKHRRNTHAQPRARLHRHPHEG